MSVRVERICEEEGCLATVPVRAGPRRTDGPGQRRFGIFCSSATLARRNRSVTAVAMSTMNNE